MKDFIVLHQICGDDDIDVIGPPTTEVKAEKIASELQDKVDAMNYDEEFWTERIITRSEYIESMRDNS